MSQGVGRFIEPERILPCKQTETSSKSTPQSMTVACACIIRSVATNFAQGADTAAGTETRLRTHGNKTAASAGSTRPTTSRSTSTYPGRPNRPRSSPIPCNPAPMCQCLFESLRLCPKVPRSLCRIAAVFQSCIPSLFPLHTCFFVSLFLYIFASLFQITLSLIETMSNLLNVSLSPRSKEHVSL